MFIYRSIHSDVTLLSHGEASNISDVENDIDHDVADQFEANPPTSHEGSESQPPSDEHIAISSGDFGKVVGLKLNRKLTDHEKYLFLTNHFVPPRNYQFPPRLVGGLNRHFQWNWLQKFNGLVYSESENGGYCKYCVLFARGSSALALGTLVTRPLIDFKRATEKISDHFQKKFHKAAVQEAESFSAVDHCLSSHRSRLADQNRLKLTSIVETILFCGRQGFALRGHRDDGTSIDDIISHGNFLALLRFRVQAGDKVLEEHIETAGRNARYTSKTVQNEMMEISGNIVRRKILQMVKKAGFFSVIVF